MVRKRPACTRLIASRSCKQNSPVLFRRHPAHVLYSTFSFLFRTLAGWQELVKYTASVHETNPNTPRVILIANLHDYYRDRRDDDDQTRLAHMLCACLRDAITYCGRACNSTAYLTVSTQDSALETNKLSAMYFPSSTWIGNVDGDQVQFCKKQLYPHQSHSRILKFFKVNDKLRCDSVEILYL